MPYTLMVDEMEYAKLRTGLHILIQSDLDILESLNRRKPRNIHAIRCCVFSLRYNLRLLDKLEEATTPDVEERENFMRTYRTVKAMKQKGLGRRNQ